MRQFEGPEIAITSDSGGCETLLHHYAPHIKTDKAIYYVSNQAKDVFPEWLLAEEILTPKLFSFTGLQGPGTNDCLRMTQTVLSQRWRLFPAGPFLLSIAANENH
jgi:hypothetical protein